MRDEDVINDVTKCVPTGKHGSGWEGSCAWAGSDHSTDGYKGYKCGQIYGPTYCEDRRTTCPQGYPFLSTLQGNNPTICYKTKALAAGTDSGSCNKWCCLDDSCTASSCNVQTCASNNNVNDTTNKLSLLYNQLTKLSKEMWKRTQKIHSADAKIQVQIKKNREKINDTMTILDSHRNKFVKMRREHSTLDGKLQSNKHKLDSEHTRYLAWFVLASAFGGFAIFKALR